MAIVGAATFSEFFVLTLYLQDVLHYTAMQSGVAFIGFAGTVVVVSNLAQRVIARFGVRTTLTAGLVLAAASLALARPPAGRRPLLLGSLPGVRDRRSRPRAVVRVDLDREPRRRRAPGRRHRCRALQHVAPDRRRDRDRGGERHRRHCELELRLGARRRGRVGSGARPRLPDGADRARRLARRGRGPRVGLRPAPRRSPRSKPSLRSTSQRRLHDSHGSRYQGPARPRGRRPAARRTRARARP